MVEASADSGPAPVLLQAQAVPADDGTVRSGVDWARLFNIVVHSICGKSYKRYRTTLRAI